MPMERKTGCGCGAAEVVLLPRLRILQEEQGMARMYIAAENRLLRKALFRVLMSQGDIDLVGLTCGYFAADVAREPSRRHFRDSASAIDVADSARKASVRLSEMLVRIRRNSQRAPQQSPFPASR